MAASGLLLDDDLDLRHRWIQQLVPSDLARDPALEAGLAITQAALAQALVLLAQPALEPAAGRRPVVHDRAVVADVVEQQRADVPLRQFAAQLEQVDRLGRPAAPLGDREGVQVFLAEAAGEYALLVDVLVGDDDEQ